MIWVFGTLSPIPRKVKVKNKLNCFLNIATYELNIWYELFYILQQVSRLELSCFRAVLQSSHRAHSWLNRKWQPSNLTPLVLITTTYDCLKKVTLECRASGHQSTKIKVISERSVTSLIQFLSQLISLESFNLIEIGIFCIYFDSVLFSISNILFLTDYFPLGDITNITGTYFTDTYAMMVLDNKDGSVAPPTNFM